MKSMGSINRLTVEIYTCVTCEKNYDDEDVRHTWKCPKCNNYIYIYAEGHVDPDNHIVIIRKRASELEKGDLFLMPGNLDGNSYMVLGIAELKNKLGIGLQGWGQYKLHPDDPVNCLA
jgi:ribosomal protein L37AE/L43A